MDFRESNLTRIYLQKVISFMKRDRFFSIDDFISVANGGFN